MRGGSGAVTEREGVLQEFYLLNLLVARILLAGLAGIVGIQGSSQTLVSIPEPMVFRSPETRRSLAANVFNFLDNPKKHN